MGKKRIFPELVKNLAYCLNVKLAQVFGVDSNLQFIYNDKNI